MEIDWLVLAVVQREDADEAIRALNQAGLAVTLIASVGGFLGADNITLLIGLGADAVERALGLLKTCCRQRIVPASRIPAATETPVGGATIFIFSVTRYVHFSANHTIVDSQREPSKPGTLQMILAIVAQEQAGKLTETLIDWSYRVTLIGTTGGFLRRGNATLLIGARAERVESIVEQIRQTCETNSLNEPSATIFVLNTAHFERI